MRAARYGKSNGSSEPMITSPLVKTDLTPDVPILVHTGGLAVRAKLVRFAHDSRDFKKIANCPTVRGKHERTRGWAFVLIKRLHLKVLREPGARTGAYGIATVRPELESLDGRLAEMRASDARANADLVCPIGNAREIDVHPRTIEVASENRFTRSGRVHEPGLVAEARVLIVQLWLKATIDLPLSWL